MSRISLGELREDKDATHEQCREGPFCSIPCGGPMISVPAIPRYYGRTRRQLICRNHIHNWWGALAWYEQENNLERVHDRDRNNEILFTEKEMNAVERRVKRNE